RWGVSAGASACAQIGWNARSPAAGTPYRAPAKQWKPGGLALGVMPAADWAADPLRPIRVRQVEGRGRRCFAASRGGWLKEGMEGWQNGYCTGLENRRAQAHQGSNPWPSASFLVLEVDGRPRLDISWSQWFLRR